MTRSTKDSILSGALWLAQIFIALSFCWAAYMKTLAPIAEVSAMWHWTGELSASYVRILGIIDFAGGIGVLLPALTRIMPGLTPVAALGCVLLQICAMIFHLSRGEASVLPVNIVFLSVSLFIFWGRWKRLPILSRRSRY